MRDWWRRAVVYEVYIRSFADSDGDGVGDINGIRSRLPYLRDLGVDAIWITPWYPSPMADGGYDVADYRDIDPLFGTLADADALVREAHTHGLRVLIDLVPNHTSSAHPWFVEALASSLGSRARRRYWFRDGRGPDGSAPPTDAQSVFGGSAWTRVTEADGRPGQWYLHLFAPEQPDLCWEDQDVRTEFEGILRFWFDRGVDGFRIDVADMLVKDPTAIDSPESLPPDASYPFSDQPGVFEIHRSWRRIADAEIPPRVLVGEIHGARPERDARYLRSDGLHGAFNFSFLRSPWEAEALREVIRAAVTAFGAVGAPPTWVLSNHDEIRHVTRYGGSDVALGTRRARAAALLMLALPGVVYLYQGEELGLPEVTDLPDDALQDPVWMRSGHTKRGRDGCRVPLPWSGDVAPYGFGPEGSVPWLPQPESWGTFAADRQGRDPWSMLALYRSALAIRRTHPDLAGADVKLLEDRPGVVHLRRGDRFGAVIVFDGGPVDLPPAAAVLLASGPLDSGTVPADTAAWYEASQETSIGTS